MKYFFLTALAACILTSCSKESEPSAAAPSAVEAAAAALPTELVLDAPEVVEVGCGGCIFKMPGAKGCEPAIRIDGQAIWTKGQEIDVHNNGMCAASKKAEITGALEDGFFVVKSVDFQEEKAAE